MSKASFKNLNENGANFANPRNAAAGMCETARFKGGSK